VKKRYVLVFLLIGAVLGGAVGLLMQTKLFESYITMSKDYVNEDWNRMEYFLNQSVDRIIELEKMMKKDGIKINKEDFDQVVSTRSRILGADSLAEKAELLEELEYEMNRVIEFYNKKMDLRRERFFYLRWGIETEKLIEEYKKYRDRYRNTVNEYNHRIKSLFFSGIAKSKGHFELPLIDESKIAAVQLATEPYTRD